MCLDCLHCCPKFAIYYGNGKATKVHGQYVNKNVAKKKLSKYSKLWEYVKNQNYKIEKIHILLNEDCITARYYPLIPYKQKLVEYFLSNGLKTKDECSKLTDSQLQDAGLPDSQSIILFRQFLNLYNYKGKGLKDISDLENRSEEEINSLLELMLLPGVKNIRANLYYQCGLKSLKDFAVADAEELQKKISEQIKEKGLEYSCPLLKELRTQIAVAKAFVE